MTFLYIFLDALAFGCHVTIFGIDVNFNKFFFNVLDALAFECHTTISVID